MTAFAEDLPRVSDVTIRKKRLQELYDAAVVDVNEKMLSHTQRRNEPAKKNRECGSFFNAGQFLLLFGMSGNCSLVKVIKERLEHLGG